MTYPFNVQAINGVEKMATTFYKVPKVRGGEQITINVERDGLPFGQLWTFPNKVGFTHPWHAKPLNGEHRTFATKKAAKNFMKSV